ncbi:MAG TPA: efflux RND transporter periplasmic adaptor subunit [Bacteroidia bacterium]|nr:efflux RND transporter periplasmic adaptor subunit [Bacteroidia bacterium]
MKNLFLISGVIIVLASCNSSETDKKKKELDKLKAELSDLQTEEAKIQTKESETEKKIAKLKTELGVVDSVQAPTIIAVNTLKPETFKNYIDVQGHVDADENVGISTEMPGTISKINVHVGDQVTKGQVLAETDARAILQNISDLQTNADLVNQLYDKQKNLWDQKIGTEIQYLQAKTNKESMEKKMAALQEQLRMSKIISPIDGTVDAVDVKLGQATAPGMPAIRVINYSNLKVKAEVSENYASKIHKGSPVIIRFPDTDDSVLTTVSFVSRAINTGTRAFIVEVNLDGQKEYHPNMVAKLSINDYQSSKPIIVIPVRVVQKDENSEQYVYLSDKGKAKKQLVTLGKEYNGKAEVVSGLKEGDVIVTSGYDLINEGDPIQVK